VKKKLLVTSIDISLFIILVAFFWNVTSWVVLVIATPMLFLIVDHYFVTRACYLEDDFNEKI